MSNCINLQKKLYHPPSHTHTHTCLSVDLHCLPRDNRNVQKAQRMFNCLWNLNGEITQLLKPPHKHTHTHTTLTLLAHSFCLVAHPRLPCSLPIIKPLTLSCLFFSTSDFIFCFFFLSFRLTPYPVGDPCLELVRPPAHVRRGQDGGTPLSEREATVVQIPAGNRPRYLGQETTWTGTVPVCLRDGVCLIVRLLQLDIFGFIFMSIVVHVQLGSLIFASAHHCIEGKATRMWLKWWLWVLFEGHHKSTALISPPCHNCKQLTRFCPSGLQWAMGFPTIINLFYNSVQLSLFCTFYLV